MEKEIGIRGATSLRVRSMMPAIEDIDQYGRRYMDVYSRLIKDRIMFIVGEIDDHMAADVVAQLIYLNTLSDTEPIWLYINSPGGSVSAGFAIFDTMQYITAPVNTVCIGMAASMGAFLLAAGDKRLALPNVEIMVHQPMGGVTGQASDIEINARHIIEIKARMNEILAKLTGQPLDQIIADTDRDRFMTAEQAKAYGLIDRVVTSEKTIR